MDGAPKRCTCSILTCPWLTSTLLSPICYENKEKVDAQIGSELDEADALTAAASDPAFRNKLLAIKPR